MVFADPPYNLQLGGDLFRPEGGLVDAVDDDWDKFATFAAYDDFTRAWLKEARRILKPNGTLWVIGSYHNIFRVGAALQDAGYWILNDIIWRKSNPMPNFRGTRFTNAHETLIWASPERGQPLHLQLPGDEGPERRASDALGLAASDLLGRRAGEGRRHQGPSHPEAGKPALPGDARLHQSRATSSSTPSSAPARPARSPGGWAGSWIGIEREKRYVRVARERIDSTLELDESAMKTMASKRSQPRVPFGALVEIGMIQPGTLLTDSKRRWQARVRADASIEMGGRGRLDPPHRRPRAGRARLQRLGFLAFRGGGRPRAARLRSGSATCSLSTDPDSSKKGCTPPLDTSAKQRHIEGDDRPFTLNARTPLTTGDAREPL